MANPTLQIILLTFIISYLPPTIAIYKTVCDCSKPITKGLFSMSDPYYCKTKPIDHDLPTRKDYTLDDKNQTSPEMDRLYLFTVGKNQTSGWIFLDRSLWH